ncbi:MAG: NADH-quinone oxidoreductase subunit L [Rhizobiaceae bacterium]|nr:NADH-quinone oxidoreductase subunit L [Rhizobiaceae bacterium]
MYHLIVFLPLIGFLLAGLFAKSLGTKGCEWITTGLLFVSAILSWVAFISVGFSEAPVETVTVLRWVSSGDLNVNWAFRIDTLTVVMLVVVNTVSALVHLYSIGYMHHDPHRPRFFAYLSLFTFAMLMLVTSDNLLQMFFGWEGVGLASYLLIGFWFKKPSANSAAMKAFIVNRVGDFGFALGIFGVFYLFNTIEFSTIFANVDAVATSEETVINFLGYALNGGDALTVVCLLLFMGAMGKSAQFLLHTWLPDAMEGPTPVSALIHAATMVTAGVFLVARMSPVFEFSATALTVVTLFGAVTAFFAATIGLVQNDIKRVIAYSTCSQLGYMFAALGVGAYGAAVFHLFTHAFFKALLFLGAGSVIHAVSDEQDMRKMGGLRKHIPKTYWMMVIGTVALTGLGIPGTYIGTAGFFSKDAIIESVYVGQNAVASGAFWMLVIAALFTSFYSWRLIFLTFHGKPRASADVMSHVHESPNVMLVPLYILAVGALFAGVVFYGAFLGHEVSGDHEGWYNLFWREALFAAPDNNVLTEYSQVAKWVKWSPAIVMALGFVIAYIFYIRSPNTPKELAKQHPAFYQFLLNKWYFDEIYDFLFVRPSMWIGRFFWKKGDGWLIDGFGPDGVSARVQDITGRIVKLQSGYLYHYAFAMMIGIAALISWTMFGGAG